MCPAGPVNSAEHGSPTGSQSHTQGLEDYLIRIVALLYGIKEMSRQTVEQVSRLAAANEALVQAMAQEDGIDGDEPATYLDGTPVR